MRLNKPLAIIITFAVAAPVCGCSLRGGKDAVMMSTNVVNYIEAFAADDDARARTLTDFFEYYVDDPQVLLSDGVIPETLRGDPLLGVCLHAASRAQVVDNEAPEINKGEGTASMGVEISYINLHDLYEDCPSDYLSYDEYIAYIDGYDEFSTAELDVDFIWDEINSNWLITEESARDINALLIGDRSILNAPVTISPDEARALFEEFIGGDYSNLTDGALNPEDFRGFENTTERGEGQEALEAVGRFAEAYLEYIREHDYEITSSESYPYVFTLHGSAPSDQDLYESLCTHEFYVEYYICWIRYSNLDWYREETMDDITVLVYDTLTAAIADAEPQDYELTVEIDADGTADEFFSFETPILPVPLMGTYEADHSISNDEFLAANEEALHRLHDTMEISEVRMEALIDSLYSQYGTAPAGLEVRFPENAYGRVNQAVDVHENEPVTEENEESRGTTTMITGSSASDENRFWMFYSRNPDMVDGVAYYIDDTGIYVTVYFTDDYDESTSFYGVWRTGDGTVSQEEYSFPRSGSNQLEVHYAMQQFPEPGVYELALYQDDDADHLIYVRLVNDGQ